MWQDLYVQEAVRWWNNWEAEEAIQHIIWVPRSMEGKMICRKNSILSAQPAAFEWQEQSCANSLNPWKTKKWNQKKMKFLFSFFFLFAVPTCQVPAHSIRKMKNERKISKWGVTQRHSGAWQYTYTVMTSKNTLHSWSYPSKVLFSMELFVILRSSYSAKSQFYPWTPH